MITAFMRNIYEKIGVTKTPKIIPKNVDNVQKNDHDSPEKIFTYRSIVMKRRPQIGDLIAYRTRRQSIIIYPEQHLKPEEPLQENLEVKEQPIDVKKHTIKVKVDVIKGYENQEIVKKFNEMKPPDWPPLEILQRAEGGFQIEIPEKKNIKCANQNQKMKQLRWMNKTLVRYKNFISFNDVELQILYKAMHIVLGDNVYLE